MDKHEPRGMISRRTFLAGLAGVSLVTLPMPRAEALPQFDPFSFIFVSDCHLVNGRPDTGEKLLQESQLFLQEAIRNFNLLKPDFVLFGGDMIEQVGKDEINWSLFSDVVQQLQVPWSFVLGEEDVSGKIPPDKMKIFGPDWKARGVDSTNPYWSLNPVPGVHLIGLDTSVPNNSGGSLSEEQLNWFKEDLAANRTKFTVVFCHHPLLPPAPYDGGPPWSDYTIPNGADAREVIGTTPNVRLVVSGHLYMNKIQIERDVWHVSSAGLNVYPCQFKMFRITRDAILVETFTVNFPALVKKGRKALVDSTLSYKYDSKDREAFVRLCEGGREDQDSVLPLTGGARAPQPLSKKDKQALDAKTKAAQEKDKGKGKEKGKDKDKDEKAKEERGKDTEGKNTEGDTQGKTTEQKGKDKKGKEKAEPKEKKSKDKKSQSGNDTKAPKEKKGKESAKDNADKKDMFPPESDVSEPPPFDPPPDISTPTPDNKQRDLDIGPPGDRSGDSLSRPNPEKD